MKDVVCVSELKKIIEEKTFWYYRIDFTSTFRCSILTKPTEVVLSLVEEGSQWFRVEIRNRKNNNLLDTRRGYRTSDLEQVFGMYSLFKTKKECKDSYNSRIYDQIDKLQSYYESKLDYLNKKLQK